MLLKNIARAMRQPVDRKHDIGLTGPPAGNARHFLLRVGSSGTTGGDVAAV